MPSLGPEPYAVDRPVEVVLGNDKLEGVEIQLQRPARLSGSVVTNSRVPVVGAKIAAWRGGVRVGGRDRITNGQGRFVIPNLAAGTYVVRAYRGDASITPLSNPIVLEGAEVVEIELVTSREAVVLTR
jgi:hypothetical protein